MRRRAFDPHRLDVPAFAREGASLEGLRPLAEFPRLRDLLHPEAPPDDSTPARWSLHGLTRPRPGGEPEVRLHLQASATVPLVCQRCLGPVVTPVDIDRDFRFERDESSAAALDAEVEEDVLALDAKLDVPDLVEDELLLSLPLVPRHEVCPQPPDALADQAGMPAAAAPSPFAALAGWRKTPGGDSGVQ